MTDAAPPSGEGLLLLACDPVHAEVLSAIHDSAFTPRGERAWTPREIIDLLGLSGVRGLLAVVDDRPLGFVLWSMVVDEAEILTLAVLPRARRQGLGGRLLDAALARARKEKVAEVLLEVAHDNDAARQLYESRGFSERGRRRAYYARCTGKVDAVILGLKSTGK